MVALDCVPRPGRCDLLKRKLRTWRSFTLVSLGLLLSNRRAVDRTNTLLTRPPGSSSGAIRHRHGLPRQQWLSTPHEPLAPNDRREPPKRKERDPAYSTCSAHRKNMTNASYNVIVS